MNMKNPFTILKYFFLYKKLIKKHKVFLERQYGFNIDKTYKIWTIIDLSLMPEDIEKRLGKEAACETEIKTFMAKFHKDIPFLELNELINFYELKEISDKKYGIKYGYALYNNDLLYVISFISIFLIFAILITTLIII